MAKSRGISEQIVDNIFRDSISLQQSAKQIREFSQEKISQLPNASNKDEKLVFTFLIWELESLVGDYHE